MEEMQVTDSEAQEENRKRKRANEIEREFEARRQERRSVENGFGEEIEFRVFATYLEVDATVVNVRYAYAPTEKTMSGESDYQFAASERLLAFGMAAEYLASLGLLEEASVWDKKYKEGIQAAMEWEQKCQADRDAAFAGETEDEAEQEKESVSAPNAAGTMPTRRWV